MPGGGLGATTTAVGAEKPVELPDVLLAVTAILRVLPTSVEVAV
jgi:hypothetical protein